MPLYDRKERLKALLVAASGTHHCISGIVDHLAEPGDAVLKSACRLHLEGIISKRADARLPVGPHRDLGEVQMPRGP